MFTNSIRLFAAATVLAASAMGIAPSASPFGASAAEAQTYRYRPAPNYRYRPTRTYRYRAPRVPNRVKRSIRTLSRWNGNAQRRAARQARWSARRSR
jgi:hypothetical protein